MSYNISKAVWAHSRQRGATLLVLLAIADKANLDGYCTFGLRAIARRARLSQRATAHAINRLEKAGELVVDRDGRTEMRLLVTVGLNREQIRRAAQIHLYSDNAHHEPHYRPLDVPGGV